MITWLSAPRLVVPLDRGGPGGTLVALDSDGSRACGRVLSTYGAFMPTRARSRGTPPIPDPTGVSARPTTLTAAEVTDSRGPFEFYLALRLGGLTHVSLRTCRQEQLFLLRDESWVCLPDDGSVQQGGPGRLWNDIEALHAEWIALGRPVRERFGLTVDGSVHTWWLDDPDTGPRWPFG